MIYITGDTHNTEDMSNLSSKNMKLCCMEQNSDFHAITAAIVLGDFGLPWSSDCTVDESGIHPTDHTDLCSILPLKNQFVSIFSAIARTSSFQHLTSSAGSKGSASFPQPKIQRKIGLN